MNDREVIKLLELLADYAQAYGADCDSDMSVTELVDDLRGSIGNYEIYGARAEGFADVIVENLGRKREGRGCEGSGQDVRIAQVVPDKGIFAGCEYCDAELQVTPEFKIPQHERVDDEVTA